MNTVFLFDADSPAGQPNWAHTAYRDFFRAVARSPFGSNRILVGDIVHPRAEGVMGPWRSSASAACLDHFPFDRDDVFGRRNIFAILVEDADPRWASRVATALDACPMYLGHREVRVGPDGRNPLGGLLPPRFWGVGRGVAIFGTNDAETRDPSVEALIRDAGCVFIGYSRTRPTPLPEVVAAREGESTTASEASAATGATSGAWQFSSDISTLAWWTELLPNATALDAAFYVMEPGPVADLLLQRARGGLRLRILVSGDPALPEIDLMRQLQAAAPGCLRRVTTVSPELFYGSFALLRRGARGALIVGAAHPLGSAYAAGIGSSMRVEGELPGFTEPARWFEVQWSAGAPIDEAWLDAREAHWEDDGPPARIDEETRSRDLARARAAAARVASLDWREYVGELERLDEVWRRYGTTVFSGGGWLEALEQVAPLAQRAIESLNGVQLAALFGDNLSQDAYPSCAHFGRMNGAGNARHFLTQTSADSRRIQSQFTRALAALGAPGDPAPSWENLAQCYARLRATTGIGGAVATRYMMLRRPDYLISVNSASRRRLAKVFDLSPARVDRWEGYRELLQVVWAAPWSRSPAPPPGRARQAWLGRAALIDVFAYEPKRLPGPSEEEIEGE